MFAGVYSMTSLLADLLHVSTHTRAELLIAVPKVLQAVIAAYGDYYTWKMAEQVYGRESPTAWAAVCSRNHIVSAQRCIGCYTDGCDSDLSSSP